MCTTPGCTTNQNFLLQAAQGFMACFYYDDHTAPMLVKVISLQFLPLLHHNYSLQSTNLSPQITGWLLFTKRASNGTAQGQVAAYCLSYYNFYCAVSILLCPILDTLEKSIHYQYCYNILKVTALLQLPLESVPGLNAPENKTPHLDEFQQMNAEFNQTLRGRWPATGTLGLDVPKIKIRHHKKVSSAT